MAQTARKFRMYPTDAQKEVLRAWEGCARFVYNAKREQDCYEWWLRRHAILSPSWMESDPMQDTQAGIDQRFSHLKTEQTQFLCHVPSQVLRNAATQYRQAWANRWRNPAHFGKPTPRRKYSCGVLLTKELFRFEQDGRLWIGTAKRAVGYVSFRAHRSWRVPNQITITEHRDGSWWLSFTFDDQKEIPAPVPLTPSSSVLGVDRGVAVALALSNGCMVNMQHSQEQRLRKRQQRIKALQRRLARQKRGSKRRERTKRIIGRMNRKVLQSREDFCHKASHTLANAPFEVISFEKLMLKNMTASAKGTLEDPGTNVKAKAGLNRSILDRSLGRICQYTAYKAAKQGKHVRYERAAYSSQECAVCGFTSAHNRLTQAGFYCQACGHRANADTNAAAVIAARTQRWLKLEFTTGGATHPPLGIHGVTDANQRLVSVAVATDAPTSTKWE